jgi:two-component sensor histidine kinase
LISICFRQDAMTPQSYVRRAMLATKPTVAQGLIGAGVALAIPTVLTFALDGWLANLPPFLTFFPAVTLAALVLGARWGSIILLLSAALCDYVFLPPRWDWSLSINDLVVMLIFLFGGALILVTGEALRRSAQRLQAAAAREHELNAELKHRVNNNLAAIQGMARQIIRSRSAPEAFYETFSRRLDALREAHAVLSSTDWVSCDLPRLADRGLKAFQQNTAIKTTGPACTLPPGSCVPLTLALHELATNAMMYGALSVPEGEVAVDWTVEGKRFVLRWLEKGGPAVQAPVHKGMGARLLASQQGLDEVVIDYHPAGVRCTITIDGARLG